MSSAKKKRASCFVLIVLDTYPSYFSWLIILYKPYVYTSSCKSSIIDFRLISPLSGTPKISRSGKLYILHEGFYVMETDDWPPTTFFPTFLGSRDGKRAVPICENIVIYKFRSSKKRVYNCSIALAYDWRLRGSSAGDEETAPSCPDPNGDLNKRAL